MKHALRVCALVCFAVCAWGQISSFPPASSSSGGGFPAGSQPYYFGGNANGGVCDGSTSDAAAFNALLTTIYNAGKDAEIFLVGLCDVSAGLSTFPNNGATPPQQYYLRITAFSGNSNGVSGALGGGSSQTGNSLAPTSGLIMTATSSTSDIDTRGAGVLEIDHILLRNKATASPNCPPFIHTTNTTLNVHDNLFQGQAGASVYQCAIGIVLGGTNGASGTFTAPYQGYPGFIERNIFDGMGEAVKFNVHANAITVRANSIAITSKGTAAIDMACGTSDGCRGNTVEGNLIEVGNFSYGVICGAFCSGNTFLANQTWDPNGGTTLAAYNMAGSSSNTVISSHDESATGWVEFLGCGGATSNTCLGQTSTLGTYSQFSPSSAQSGMNFGSVSLVSSDPSSAKGGDVYYNQSCGKVRVYQDLTSSWINMDGTSGCAALPAAPLFVQAKTAATASSQSTGTISMTSLPTVGNLLVVFCGISGGATLAITDNQSTNTYTSAGSGTGGGTNFHAWTAPVSASSGTFTLTCTETGGTGFISMGVAEYSGANISTPLDVYTAAGNGASSPFVTGSLTTTQFNDTLVGFLFAGVGGSYVGVSPYTMRFSTTTQNLAFLLDGTAASAGTYSPQATGPANSRGMTVAIKHQ